MKPDKKILIISQYHPPEIGAAATRWRDYARILSRTGFSVTVLTEIPNYPTGIVEQPYRRFKPVREKDDAGLYEIIRIPVWANPRKTTLQRLGFYFSFLISALVYLRIIKRFDSVIVTSPPLTVGVIGLVYRKMGRGRVFLDVRDLWPESAVVLGELKSRLTRNLAERIEKELYRNMDGFTIAVPGFRNYLESKIPRTPVIDLPNGVSNRFLKLAAASKTEPEKKFRVLFSGNIGLAQDLGTVIAAAEKVKHEQIEFMIIGEGVNRSLLVAKTKRMNLTNISFSPPVSQERLITEIKKASICLVPLIKSPLFKNAIPSKMIEYLACGRPVIATIPGETGNLIEQSRSGLITSPGDAEALSDAILFYYQHPDRCWEDGQNGYRVVSEHWIKEKLAAPLITALQQD